jgi:PAS domain S-box-containing protein
MQYFTGMSWHGLHGDDASTSTEADMSGFHWHRLWLSVAIALCGIVLSSLFYAILRRQEQQLADVQFRYDAEKRVQAIQMALNNRMITIGTLATYFAGSELVEQNEFDTFVAPLQRERPGIQALGWAPRIRAAEREAHERFVRGERHAKYEITDLNDRGESVCAGARGEYFPILFVKSADKNQDLLGLDIRSDPRYRAATERATATGQPAAVVFDRAAKHPADEALLLVVVPAKNDVPSSAKRPADQPESDGFVFGLFSVAAIVESAIKSPTPVGIDISIVAPLNTGSERCVYAHISNPHARGEPSTAKQSAGDLQFSGDITVADSRWKVDCVPCAAYVARYRTWGPVAVLVAGLLITGLLVGFFFLLVGRAARIEQLASERTRRLHEGELKLGAILDQAYQFIGLLTPEGVVIEVNRSALAFGGVSAADVRNKPFWETPWWSHSPKLQEELRDAVKRAAQGEFVRMEATHPAANGELHWIDFSLKPVKDETGKVVFLIPEGRDITARKQIEEALHKEQRLLRTLLDLNEQDRKLTAYEIHDGLAQQLAGALYKFQSIDALREHDLDAARELFDESLQLLRGAMAETRRLISGLRPPILDESGVVDAVEYLVSEQNRRGGPQIEFVHSEGFGRLAPPLESAAFRIVQECLTNACRYSKSDRIRVEIRQVEEHVHVEVRDWGVGFDPTGVSHEHYGLQGIRERARLLGGAAAIETAPGKGTCVSVDLPLLPPIDDESPSDGAQE